MQQLELFKRKDLEEDVPLRDGIIYITDECWDLCEFEQKLLGSTQLGFDIETYGELPLDGLRWWRGKIRLMQFSFSEKECYVLDWLKLSEATKKHILPTIKLVLESYEVEKWAFNGKFECCFCIGQLGIHPRNFRDPMLMSQLLYTGVKQLKHSLEACCDRYLQIQVNKDEQTSNWGELDLMNKQINYAAMDATIMWPLVATLKRLIKVEKLTYQAKLECLFMHVLAEMQCNGFPVSSEYIEMAIADHEAYSKKMTQSFYATFPNLSITTSHPKMTHILNEQFNIGLLSTEDAELSLHKDIPEIKAIADYRSIKKHLDYLRGMQLNCRNERAYSDFRQLTGFGRTSSSRMKAKGYKTDASDGINLQNAPKPIPETDMVSVRKCFRPGKGKAFINCDLSGAHAVFGTELSQDPVLLDIYNNEKDVHLVTAVGLAAQDGHDLDYDTLYYARKNPDHEYHDYTGKIRDLAKPIFYGSLNLQGAFTLQKTAAKEGIYLTEDEATNSRNVWRDIYKKLYYTQKKLIMWANDYRKKCSFVDGVFGWAIASSGRRLWMRKFPDPYHSDGIAVKGTDCVAFHWAALEIEVVKQAGVWCQNQFDNHPEWQAKIVNLCHDEFDVECLNEYAIDVARCVKQAMAKAMRKWVRSIPVETNKNYADYIKPDWSEK